MKIWNVTIESKNDIISSFTILAKCYKDAFKLANFNKRMNKQKGRVHVHLTYY